MSPEKKSTKKVEKAEHIRVQTAEGWKLQAKKLLKAQGKGKKTSKKS